MDAQQRHPPPSETSLFCPREWREGKGTSGDQLRGGNFAAKRKTTVMAAF